MPLLIRNQSTDRVETLLHAAIAGIASLPQLLAQAPIAQGALVSLRSWA